MPNVASSALRPTLMPSRPVATDITGTLTVPAPFAPSTVTYTLYAPRAISQRCPAYRRGAPATGFAASGDGEPATPARQKTGRMSTRCTSPLNTRTATSAKPGTTSGTLTITRTAYGP